ncbi:hypothetical protein L228DRAFT_248004 [Xylona heveae TC161]|uniref:Rhodopsin domain-containing protein n=1 Tax=Xylona heveae (strain CBS 132557 / TC161) TaxID=1328760 RepID=A0A165GLF7_XYLHT|nr:hypothetical protein L228DRAFT_248004 [Xylona heveae TC161]KZF22334.1 hypothetical protein L228DRAFT_248004 [Xylona heveae TC161]
MDRAAESDSYKIIACHAALIAISTIAVGLRLYSRVIVVKHAGWDDFLCALSYVLIMTVMIIDLVSCDSELGRHWDTLSMKHMEQFLKYQFAVEMLYIAAFMSIKMSYVCLYLRIFPHRTFRIINYCLLAFLTCNWLEETMVVVFQCHPVAHAFMPLMKGSCLNLLTFYYVSFGIKLATDLIVFSLPIPMMRGANMPKAQYIGVLVMFTLGFFVCIVSIIRATYLKDSITDATWLLVDQLNWSVIEVNTAVIASCIPALKTLVMQSSGMRRLLGMYRTHGASSRDHYDLKTNNMPLTDLGRSRHDKRERILEDGESEENIMANGSEPGHGDITVTTKWSIITSQHEAK